MGNGLFFRQCLISDPLQNCETEISSIRLRINPVAIKFKLTELGGDFV